MIEREVRRVWTDDDGYWHVCPLVMEWGQAETGAVSYVVEDERKGGSKPGIQALEGPQ